MFGNRVYIYGSHDKEGGDCFCLLDYEAWSAPVDDLTDWRCEGIIYQAKQCRHYCEERQDMYAPDVVQGNDGRYYLYYDLSGRGDHGFDGPISVAVCDTPAGKYEYYGDGLIEASKIFVNKEGEDITSLGTLNFTGCVDISYNDLLNADLIQPFDDENVDCSNARIRYTKERNKDSYTINLTCRNKTTNEVLYQSNDIPNTTCTVTAY